MNAARKSPVLPLLLLLACGLAGCAHKAAPPPPPPVATAPALKPEEMTVEQPLPPVPPVKQPRVSPPGSDQKPAPSTASTKPAPRHRTRRKSADTPVPAQSAGAPAPSTTAPPAASADASAAAPPVAATPPAAAPAETHPAVTDPAATSIGQLSAGTPVNGADRSAMLEQIKQQENRLHSLKNPGSSDSAAVLTQVRAFLDKAKQAITENDLVGARTLTTKAKLLLDELTGS